MARLVSRRPWRLAVNLSLAVVLSAAAMMPTPPETGLSDLTLHGLAYGVQAALLVWLLVDLRPDLVRALLAAAGSTALGCLTELLQATTSLRHAELRDLAADAVGAVLVTTAWLLMRRLRSVGG